MDIRQNDDQRLIKIGINLLTNNDGIFSLDKIIVDQKNLTDRDKEKLIYKEPIYIKQIKDNELYVVTTDLTKQIVRELHNNYGHVGIHRTWKLFRENYYNKYDRQITKYIIKRWHMCQLPKEKSRHYEGIPKSIRTNRPRQIIAIDFISNLIPSYNGSRHIFLIVDNFSKYVRIYPCRKTNTKTVIQLLDKYRQEEGPFENCILDNATYFRNTRLTNYFRQIQTRPHYTSIRHPKANPAERYVKEVSKYLRILVHDDHPQWENYLIDVEHYLNHIPNNVTEENPITIFKNIQPDRPWTISKNIQYDRLIQQVNDRLLKAAERYQKRMTRKKTNTIQFNKGDLVVVRTLRVPNRKEYRCARLMLPYDGPYVVNTINGTNSYELTYVDTERIKGIYNVNQLQPYYEDRV